MVTEYCRGTDSTLDPALGEYVELIHTWCHLDSFYINLLNYETLESTVEQNLDRLLKRERIIIPLGELPIFTTLLVFSIYKAVCETNTNLTPGKSGDSIVFIEFLENCTSSLYTQLIILQHYEPDLVVPSCYQLKSIILLLVAVLINSDTKLFSLQTVEHFKILSWRELYGDKELFKTDDYRKKVIIIDHHFCLAINYRSLFKLCLSQPKLLSTNGGCFLSTKFPPYAISTIRQRHNRIPTVVTDIFNNTLLSLSSVKMQISTERINAHWSLIELEFKKLKQQLRELPEHTTDLENILQDLLNLSHKITTKMIVRTLVAKTTKGRLLSYVHDNSNKSYPEDLREELNRSRVILQLKEKWDSLLKNNGFSETNVRELQEIFSRCYQYYIFGLFKRYLEITKLQEWYFLTYADFRGRFYYDSMATPQSFWGFRHIYLCDNTYFDATLYYKALGTLFKKEVTDEQSRINISQLETLGQFKYKQLKSLDLNEQHGLVQDLSTLAEATYYCLALTTESGRFFVWRDTTCSMAQHAGKVLGFRTENLAYLNLSNDKYAYDTYGIIIFELKKLLQKRGWCNKRLELLTRSLLKHVIMTTGYGVTFYTAYQRHKKLVSTKNYTHSDKEWLLDAKIFREIFNLLAENTCYDKFYLTSKSDWEKKQNMFEFFALPDISFNAIYLKQSIKLKNLELTPKDGKRNHHQVSFTLRYSDNPDFYLKQLKEKELADIVDKHKTQRALYVNIIHALDAYYMRNLVVEAHLRKCQIIAVHDGFAIAPANASWLISTANLVFNKPNPPFSFSQTILL